MADRLWLVALLALVGPAPSLAQMPAPVQVAAPVKTLRYLSPADVAPMLLLAPPPPRGSATEAAELAEVRRIVAGATPERLAQARADDATEDPTIFDATIGGGLAMKRLPLTYALLDLARTEADLTTEVGKKYWKRVRPWGIDPSLPNCDAAKHKSPVGSYPSGHSTAGFAMALMLAQLMPTRAAIVQDRARDYAFSRLVCGVHFASDIEAAHVVSATVVARLLTTPALAPQLAAARAELKAAGWVQ